MKVTDAVNRLDPHFSYELQTGVHQPTPDELAKRGSIGSFTTWDGSTAATISIFQVRRCRSRIARFPSP